MERPAPGSLLLCGVSKRLRMRLGSVEFTGGFLLLTAWLNYLDRQGVVPLALLACALHELGHWAALRALGARVRRVRLTAVGAEMEVDRTLSYGGELLAALDGPGANLALALAFSPLTGGGLFAGLNLALACFNLLPVGQMDGGRVLRCVLAWLMGPARAHWLGARLDRFLTAGLLLMGGLLVCFGGTATLFLTSCWLFSALCPEKEGKRGCHIRRKQVK